MTPDRTVVPWLGEIAALVARGDVSQALAELDAINARHHVRRAW